MDQPINPPVVTSAMAHPHYRMVGVLHGLEFFYRSFARLCQRQPADSIGPPQTTTTNLAQEYRLPGRVVRADKWQPTTDRNNHTDDAAKEKEIVLIDTTEVLDVYTPNNEASELADFTESAPGTTADDEVNGLASQSQCSEHTTTEGEDSGREGHATASNSSVSGFVDGNNGQADDIPGSETFQTQNGQKPRRGRTRSAPGILTTKGSVFRYLYMISITLITIEPLGYSTTLIF